MGERSLAQSATQYHVNVGVPAFYVHIVFFPIPPNNFYTEGTRRAQTVFIEIDHIARDLDPLDKETSKRPNDGIDKVMKPYMIDKGFNLEYAALEGQACLWRIN
jgi:hypothetical protein